LRNVLRFGLGIVLVIITYSTIFMVLMSYEHQEQNASFINALYWVIITITTLGYGDIVFYLISDDVPPTNLSLHRVLSPP